MSSPGLHGATAIIIGAGPAGITAAYEFLERSHIVPLVLEASDAVGGICRTASHNGNRIDIGGHRFFSKSDRVIDWWLRILPLENSGKEASLRFQNRRKTIAPLSRRVDPTNEDRVMLIRNRKSRIYFNRGFFDYPLRINPSTLLHLGPVRGARILASYCWSALHRLKPETTLEQFLINRFGRELYLTFFKSYTEKVWGVPCSEISAEWGAQRIKGLSLTKTLTHLIRKSSETSLVERFLYPKYGPGQLWEYAAASVCARGGSILTGWTVDRILVDGNRVTGVEATHTTGAKRRFEGGHVISTMPVQHLVRALNVGVPEPIREIAEGLQYRDFIIAGLLLDRLRLPGHLEDNWIYLQEPDVLAGRMQIFNNWSPWMVADTSKVWIGVEYFCNENDALWKKTDAEMAAFAIGEMEHIGILSSGHVRDSTVLRMTKTYPAYFGTYHRFDELRSYLDGFENLWLVGRNGMHKYNNQDHSMLTAMTAVDNILAGLTGKSNIWSVNTEMEYGEERT